MNEGADAHVLALEARRLQALRDLKILDTAPEPEFDAVCALAQAFFAVPTVLISLVEEDRQWFKARCGFEPEATSRDVSFCALAIQSDDVFVVEDASKDARFQSNPLVTDSPGIRFYAGAPLILRAGIRVGTVCVIDVVPRAFDDANRRKLESFASIVVALLRLYETNGLLRIELREGAKREALVAKQAEELVQREAALRQSHDRLRLAERAAGADREQYRLLAENASDMIVRIDLGGTRLFVSPASLDLLGFTADEMIGTRPKDQVHPDDAAQFEAMTARLASGETDRDSVTNRLRHKDGRWIWVEAKWRVLRDGSGRPLEFIASVRDIGARRAAEERLKTSEEIYRTLADTLPQMIWIVRAIDRVAVYANRQFQTFYGAIGATRLDRIARNHPDDLDRMEASWAAAALEGRTFEIEGRLRRHDDSYRWHKIVAAPVRRDGSVVEWLCTALDIDDIVAARQKLLETSDLLTLSQEAAGAGVFDVNLVTGEATLSRESAAMHGFESAGPMIVTLAHWDGRLHPDDARKSQSLMQSACADAKTYSCEVRARLRDGRTRWIHGIGRAHYDAMGRAVRMIGLHFDVTDRKASEADLIEASAAADAARREAEQASAAKSEFLASMSHEIRTPLNSIIGYTDLLLDDESRAPSDRRKLEMIQESGSALLTVVNDILDFSKIEAGQIELDPVAFSLLALIDNVLSMIAGFADRMHLAIEREIDPGLPPMVLGDANRLRQILLNLLNNAIKFTPSGTVTLRVMLDGPLSEICRLHVTVTDTGIGISRLRRERLFQRFSQVDGSVARRFGGTGLGLAISKSLVELMGGIIGVDSSEGVGSSFWFRLAMPVAEAIDAHDALATLEPIIAETPVRILLVEDVLVNQELARLILEARGHSVVVASDGIEAVHQIQSQAFDLVLMDVQMPGMDGITATRQIRALDHPCRLVPIVAMTANVLPQQVAGFVTAGMDDHVGKPIRREALYAVIAHWAGRSHVPADQALPVLDRDIFDDLREAVGQTFLDQLVVKFARELEGRFESIPRDVDREQLARDAHAMVSASGSLGFSTLSRRCREVETICRQNGDMEDVIERLQAATRLVLLEIATWSPSSDDRPAKRLDQL